MSERPGSDPNDWLRYAKLNKQQQRFLRRQKRPDGAPFPLAIVLIGAGVLLFLGNLGVLPVRDIWVYWPVFPIAAGLGRISSARNTGAILSGVLALIFGAYFLLSNLGWLNLRFSDGSGPIAFLLIASGLITLVKMLDFSRAPQPDTSPPNTSQPFTAPSFTMQGDQRNAVNDFVLLGALKRRLETLTFNGGQMICVLGNIEIDLRRAVIAPDTRTAVLNTTAVFGAIKLRVPQHWRIHVSGISILGNFEDKTIPPSLALDASTLVITGLSLFSSVEIED